MNEQTARNALGAVANGDPRPLAAIIDSVKSHPERRERVYNIDTRFLLMAMNGMRLVKGESHSTFKVPVFNGIPEDAVVERVRYSIESDGLQVIVSHPSFDVVAEYATPPTYPELLAAKWQTVLVEECRMAGAMQTVEDVTTWTSGKWNRNVSISAQSATAFVESERPAEPTAPTEKKSWEFLGAPR